jgi:hypothetical protein
MVQLVPKLQGAVLDEAGQLSSFVIAACAPTASFVGARGQSGLRRSEGATVPTVSRVHVHPAASARIARDPDGLAARRQIVLALVNSLILATTGSSALTSASTT